MLLHHCLRRAELCHLDVGDVHDRRGILHLKVPGKGGKTRSMCAPPVSAPPRRGQALDERCGGSVGRSDPQAETGGQTSAGSVVV